MEQQEETNGGGWLTALPNILKQISVDAKSFIILAITIAWMGTLYINNMKSENIEDNLKTDVKFFRTQDSLKGLQLEEDKKNVEKLNRDLLRSKGYLKDTTNY